MNMSGYHETSEMENTLREKLEIIVQNMEIRKFTDSIRKLSKKVLRGARNAKTIPPFVYRGGIFK